MSTDAADPTTRQAESRPERVRRVAASGLHITYPAELPIAQRKDEIAAAIDRHQVVIVAGETGSGKTTQLPKICLESGRGVTGMIGHTQPRRLAARTVADRIAEELNTPLGELVGYQVRFTDRVSDRTLVKLMTDGILLAEIHHDPLLSAYDTLIIDEAHERSLNIDFLVGYLARLLPKRPDLKVVITSATIDPERFAEHFDQLRHAASGTGADDATPIVEVSGRTYPVEVRYRPLFDDGVEPDPRGQVPRDQAQRDQVQGICDAVDELCAEGPGDILVFLSGEREIRDTADALRRHIGPSPARPTEILPLYARLSTADQHKVFHPPKTGRRIVLATNVAETSLTVPGIKYVIDPGTARISRYSSRLKVQRLPIEPISQASADQRKGRCGRTSDGICVRLYPEDDYLARPRFTDPEILRTNLASVLLQMAALGLGEIEDFPFLDPPDRRQIRDGVLLLEELGALRPGSRHGGGSTGRRLTKLGRRLARLPVDPRLGRMILAAERNGTVHEVLVITAALSIQDPRERPAERQQAADTMHARFADPTSDFTGYLALWNYLQEQQEALSSSAFRRMCGKEFLHYLRIREWQDLYAQLRQAARQLRIVAPKGKAEDRSKEPAKKAAQADPEAVHTALLAGLLSHIGLKEPDSSNYAGARGSRFAIFPGSALFKKSPPWLMSAELVETSRLYARVNAAIEPEWVEPLAGHLAKYSYGEPHWDAESGTVVGYEKVTVYGLPIVPRRKVDFGRIDPAYARELFIRHALVEGDWETRHPFLAANQRRLEEVRRLEHRARRRDIVVDDEAIYAFYDQQVGEEVTSAHHFDGWWNRTRPEEPSRLDLDPATLISPDAAELVKRVETDFPTTWSSGDLRLALRYRFEPGAEDDGVTVQIPLAVLNQVNEAEFDWHVPGMRSELVTTLVRSLPKALRRDLGPAPNMAQEILARISPSDGDLLGAMEAAILQATGVRIPRDAWEPQRLPDHLRMRFRVIDERKRPLATGRDLAELKVRLADKLRATLSAASSGLERSGLTSWDFGPLPEAFEQRRGALSVKAYPALVDAADGVGIRLLDTPDEQRVAHRAGLRRLLRSTVPSPSKWVLSRLSGTDKLALSRYGSASDLFDDAIGCAIDELTERAGGADKVRDADAFGRVRDAVRAELAETTLAIVRQMSALCAIAHGLDARLESLSGKPVDDAVRDLTAQVHQLVRPGFATVCGYRRLPDLVRYLRAAERRLEKLPQSPAADRDRMLQVQQVEQEYRRRLAELRPGQPADPELREVRWMIEELRVSLFAQQLGTAYPISAKRIRKLLTTT